jgi:heme/copper-type cytochrome/quinol oxidase subunit 3
MNWPIGKNFLNYQSPAYETPTSRRATAIGMWLFLASLTMLFVSGIVLYFLLRIKVFGAGVTSRIHLPIALWFSTIVLLSGSYTIHKALSDVRRERLPQFRTHIITTLVLAVVFLAIQFPSLWVILQEHRVALAHQGIRLYGLVFCLILLHALHVVGGIVALWVVAARAMRDRYDHENFSGVKYAAAYWHFLDIIWIVMFAMFTITG